MLAGVRVGRRPIADDFRMAIRTARHGPSEAFECYVAALLADPTPARLYRAQIEHLRRGEFYAPGFAPGEKGDRPLKPPARW